MKRPNERLEVIAERVRASFSAKDIARERALRLSREVIRHSSIAIRAIHRGEYDNARITIKSTRDLLSEVSEALSEYPDLLHSGFIHDAQKEYAEACTTLALVVGEELPDPDELSVSYAAYLNGLGEAAGELRRHLLDIIRRGEFTRSEEILTSMDDIYSVLVTIDFPDAITSGLRRTTDMVRGVMERTRSDLTISLKQRELEEMLKAFQDTLGGGL